MSMQVGRFRPSARQLGSLAVAAVLAGGFAAATGSAAGAATRPGARSAASGSINGRVTSIDRSADTFTVRTTEGSTVKVKVTSSTAYSESGVSKPSFSDLQVGDSVAVIGSQSSGVDTAIDVVIGHRVSGFPGGFGRGTFGTVSSVDRSSDTFTVKTVTGSTVKVKVTSSTAFRERSGSSPASTSKASFADVKTGESVAVIGSTSHGVLTATTVMIGTFGGRGRPGGFAGGTFGKVSSVDRSADTFKLKTFSGSTVTVKVTSSTSYRDTSVSKASFTDVKVGENVAVTGSTSHGVETAKTVVIGFGRPGGAPPTTS
jgi:hypothetical protein